MCVCGCYFHDDIYSLLKIRLRLPMYLYMNSLAVVYLGEYYSEKWWATMKFREKRDIKLHNMTRKRIAYIMSR